MRWWMLLLPHKWKQLWLLQLSRDRLSFALWFAHEAAQREKDSNQFVHEIVATVNAMEEHCHSESPLDVGPLKAPFSQQEEVQSLCMQLRNMALYIGGKRPEGFVPPSLKVLKQAVDAQKKAFRKETVQFRMFSVENMGVLIPLFSAFFLVTGYIYNRVLLQPFGIDVAKFFSLGDYLAASLDGITPIVIVMLVYAFFVSYYTPIIRLAHFRRSINARLSDYFSIVALIGVTGFAIYFAGKNPHFHASALYGVGVVLVTLIPNFLALQTKEPLRAHYLMTYPLLFIIVLVFATTIERFSLDKNSTIKPSHVVMVDGVRNEVQLLSGNSSYLFVRNLDGSVHALTVESIQRVEVLKPEVAAKDQ